jgi:hypothetical protein
VNENNDKSWVYKDKIGRTILVRRELVTETTDDQGITTSTVEYAETYYTYDDFGSVTSVIPPEATKILKAKDLKAVITPFNMLMT